MLKVLKKSCCQSNRYYFFQTKSKISKKKKEREGGKKFKFQNQKKKFQKKKLGNLYCQMKWSDETGYDMKYKTYGTKLGYPWLDNDSKTIRMVMEISGFPSSGKTELAMLAAAQVVMPKELGGEQGSVIWFDNEGTLDSTRMVECIKYKLEEFLQDQIHSSTNDQALLETLQSRAAELLAQCVARIMIYSCKSNREILCVLHSISDPFMYSKNVKLMVLDNWASFYWREVDVNARFDTCMVSQFRNLVTRYPEMVLIALRPLSHSSKHPVSSKYRRSYIPEAWEQLVTHRVKTSSVLTYHDDHSNTNRQQQHYRVTFPETNESVYYLYHEFEFINPKHVPDDDRVNTKSYFFHSSSLRLKDG